MDMHTDKAAHGNVHEKKKPKKAVSSVVVFVWHRTEWLSRKASLLDIQTSKQAKGLRMQT